MKRILLGVLAFLLVLSLVPAMSITAQADTIYNAYIGNWQVTLSVTDGKGTLTGCEYGSGAVVIPSTIKGYPVVAIGRAAFTNCTTVTSITLPDSVTRIEDGGDGAYDSKGAFYGCTNLTKVTLGSGMQVIGKYAFRYCKNLTSITIPDSVTSIGESAFCCCTGLTSVTIGNGVTSIGDDAFYYCTGLTNINIPDSVTRIGACAFYGCDSLTSVTIGHNVWDIGDDAFSNCASLTTINVAKRNSTYHSAGNCLIQTANKMLVLGCKTSQIPNDRSVSSIGHGAFSGCTGLTEITIPNSVTSIGSSAFEDCDSLTSITIPDSVTRIGDSAFYRCAGLTSVALGDHVTSIGESAFRYCTSLTSITIPDGVTSIGGSAFYDCDSLTSVTIGNGVTSIGSEVFCSCNNLTSITIPDSVTSIGEDAFWDCDSLTSITIPDSVTSIGYYAFEGCTKLNQVHISDIAAWCEIDFYNIVSNPLYYADSLHLNGELVTELVVPNGVTSIGYGAFYNRTGLISATIPSSVTSIEGYAFYGCSNLQRVIFGGYQDEVANISIGSNNDPLYNAQWEYATCPGHTYDNACDTKCNVCGESRTPPHVYDHGCDTTCNGCESVRIVAHNFANGQNCSACRMPVAPTLEDKTATTVQLVAFENYQYSKDGTNWQTSNVFIDLSPNTEYTFYQRLVDSGSYFISPTSESLAVTTDKHTQETPAAPTLEAKTDTSVTLTYISGYEYSKDGKTWQISNVFSELTHNTPYAFYQRNAETSISYASPASPALQVTTIARTATITYITNQSNNTFHTQYKLEGTPITLGSVSRSGYSFYGWTTKPYGTVEFTATYTYEEEKDLTLYAVWLKVCTTCNGVGQINTGISINSTPIYDICPTCNGEGKLKIRHTVTDAPEAESCTSWSITLVQQDGMEYSLGGSTWQDSPVFTDLEPGTTYQFYQRYKENKYRSPAATLCNALAVSTQTSMPKPDVPVLFSRTHDQVILAQQAGMEYSMDRENWQSSNIFTDLKPNTSYTFYQRYAADGEMYASPASNGLTVKTNNVEYVVVFKNWDNSIISTNTYYYGDAVIVPDDPTKAADNTYTYVFDGWDNDVAENCTGDATYTATYVSTYIDYTVEFQNWDGTILSSNTYHWGDEITVPANPTKPATVTYTYTFADWDNNVVACAGNATYKATFASTYIEYTIAFKDWDGTVLSSKTYHYGDAVTKPATPQRAADNIYSYAFDGWDSYVMATCTGDETYIATYKPSYINYKVIFKNWNGKTVSDKTYHWGDTISVPANPTKESDDTCSYTFAGWDNDVVACAGNATYTAIYTPIYINYTIVFKNWDGTILSTKTYHWGDEVTAPANPSKPANNTSTYQFFGWDKEVVPCEGNATYIAVYTEEYIHYTVLFKNWDGTVLSNNAYNTYYWGEPINIPADPTKPADNTYTYTFAGWDKTVVNCEGNTTYTATYTPAYIDYIVTFKNWDGSILDSDKYHYNDTVTPPSATPTKPEDNTYKYVFKGWDSEIVKVVSNKIYTAVYDAIKKIVEITSNVFQVQGNSIEKVGVGTSTSSFVSKLDQSENVKVYKGNTQISGNTAIGTGMEVKLMDGNAVVKNYTVVVTGDTNGDGAISVTDMIAVKAHVLKKTLLTGAYAEAGDTSNDNAISITDFIQIKAQILGKSSIIPN